VNLSAQLVQKSNKGSHDINSLMTKYTS